MNASKGNADFSLRFVDEEKCLNIQSAWIETSIFVLFWKVIVTDFWSRYSDNQKFYAMPIIAFILSLLFANPQTETPGTNKNNDTTVTDPGGTNREDCPDYIIITEMDTP